MARYFIYNKTSYVVTVGDVRTIRSSGDYKQLNLIKGDFTVVDDSQCLSDQSVTNSVMRGQLQKMAKDQTVDIMSEEDYYSKQRHKRESDSGYNAYSSQGQLPGGIMKAAKQQVPQPVIQQVASSIVDLKELIKDDTIVPREFDERLTILEGQVNQILSNMAKARAKLKKIKKK